MERSALDLLLSEDQTLLRDSVRSFATEQVAPRHEALDHAAVHPEEVVAGMAGLGLFGILPPEDAGGVGMGMLAHVIAVEELAFAGGLAGGILCAHGIAVDALAASPEGRGAVAGLVTGENLGSPAFAAEPGAVAEGAGPERRVSGTWVQTPFPGRAASYVVLGPDGGLYRVDAGASGLSHEGRDPSLGLLGLETAPLILEKTPAARLQAKDAGARAMASARVQVAALLCGIGRGAVAHAARYAQERKQFDRPLADFPAIQEHIARGAARVAAALALVFDAARLRDGGEPHGVAAAKARLAAGEAVIGAADGGLQVFGGYGYSREYPADRFYRDARFLGFGEGDSTTLIAEIARDLG